MPKGVYDRTVMSGKKTFTCYLCGKTFRGHRNKVNKRNFCDRSCYGKWRSINVRGDKHHNWIDGRPKHSAGYICVGEKGSRDFEHRVIMERHLGRKLYSGEVVHHENGDKSDNSIENLVVFESNSEHQKYHHLKGNTLQNDIKL